METARAIVEAYCKKVSASPETATDEQPPIHWHLLWHAF